MALCKKCGQNLEKHNRFCPQCGAPKSEGGRFLSRKTILLFIVLVIIGVGSTIIYLSFSGDGWSEARADEILEATDIIEGYIEQQFAAGWTDRSSVLIAEQIEALSGVEYAESGGSFLLVKYLHGGEQLWLLDAVAGEAFGAGTAREAVVPSTASEPEISLLSAIAPPGLQNQKAVILNALADDPSYAAFNSELDKLEMLLEVLGFQVELYRAAEADLEKYRKLDQYDIVMIIGHGEAGSNRGRDWVKVQTGERAPAVHGEYDLLRKYWSDWRNGHISMMIFAWDPGRDLPEWQKITAFRRYWGINDNFFHHYSTSFQDSLFINWACSSMKNKAMAEALSKAGVGVYLGWTDRFGISPLPVYCILLHLAEGETLSGAIDSLPEDWKKDHRFGEAVLAFHPQAAGSVQWATENIGELTAGLHPYCREERRGKTAPVPAPAPAPAPAPVQPPEPDEIPQRWNLQFTTFWPAVDFQVAEGHEVWAKEISDRVAAETPHTINFAFHPGGTLLGPLEIYEGVAAGVADLGTTCPAYTPGMFPLTEAFELPGFNNDNALVASLTIHEAWKQSHWLQKEYEDVKIMFFWATGPGDLISNSPVRSLNDLRGKHIRAVGRSSPVLEALGGRPVGMPMSESYIALDMGLLDGILSPTDVLKGFRLAEVTRYITKTPFAYNIIFVKVMNWDTWNSFPPSVQQIFNEVNEKYVVEYGKLRTDYTVAGQRFAVNEFGHRIIELDTAETARWTGALQGIVDDWIAKSNAAGLPGREIVGLATELDVKFSKEYGGYGR